MDAIVQAADREGSVAGILDNVRGAIMFGVPCLGMEQSHLMAMVEGQANEALVRDLSPQSSYVWQLNKQFIGLAFLRTARIFWAYETQESPTVAVRPLLSLFFIYHVRANHQQLGANGKWQRTGDPATLVHPESATCRIYRKNQFLTFPINKDHSNMVKFSRGDPCLDVITSSLVEIFSLEKLVRQPWLLELEIPAANQGMSSDSGADVRSKAVDLLPDLDVKMLHQLGELLSSLKGTALYRRISFHSAPSLTNVPDLHNDLYSTELDFRVDQIEDPFQDTFKWVFDVPSFSTWLQGKSALFWIHGKPGSGKSTLMKFILQSQTTRDLLHRWDTGTDPIIADFFFHYRGSALQKSFVGLLRSLIVKILKPHQERFEKRHQQTWDDFKSLTARQRKLERQSQIIDQKLRDMDQNLRDMAHNTQPSRSGHLGPPKDRNQFEYQRDELLQEMMQINGDLVSTKKSLQALVEHFRPHSDAADTRFLTSVTTEFRKNKDGLVSKLEKALHQLLAQDIIHMDLVLFFDALDEFDGHLDMISRFLKSLVELRTTSEERHTTPKTRVRVCFSSRPWKPLKAQFSGFPGFALQEHTRDDIRRYAEGSITSSQITNASILKLVPTIITRANGVFIWVMLAIKVLLEAPAQNPTGAVLQPLEEKLKELPDDLFEFYQLIIERISAPDRYRTFALLELLVRNRGLQLTATEIRDAVRISQCHTWSDALDELEISALAGDSDDQVKNDISTWGGGLVEIKSREGVDRPQMMHQTVLEFTTGASFKKIVVGSLADLMKENGHSFHLKHRMLSRWTRLKTRPQANLQAKSQLFQRRRLLEPLNEDSEELKQIAYHAELAEYTTGSSQFDFLYSIPEEELVRLFCIKSSLTWNDNAFLASAASLRLTLCLQNWVDKNKHEPRYSSFQSVRLPLLSSLVFDSPAGHYSERNLKTVLLLLENGYGIKEDPEFFSRIVEMLWKTTVSEETPERIPVQALHELAYTCLKYGQDPNISSGGLLRSSLLHFASPALAAELIRHKANPNVRDSKSRTPLDWVLELPSEIPKPEIMDCAQRYQMCNILVQAQGTISRWTRSSVWMNAMTEFENEGYDTQFLRETFRNQEAALSSTLDGEENGKEHKKSAKPRFFERALGRLRRGAK